MLSLSNRRTIKTVTEINREIKSLFDNNFLFVRLAGEISNLHQPLSGHLYFNLKDDSSQIRAVLFKSAKKYLEKDLVNGQRVICDGKITVYQPRGEYQIVVDSVDFHGTGDLQIAFNRLKQRLHAEGMFNPESKIRVPLAPERLIVITSPSGAAVHDFISVCKKSKSSLLIQILPTRVQGEGAGQEIADRIRVACGLRPDVIVLCRGGGSIEDLWCFNEEMVARAIHHADIPIITGIGHETDFTIADFCADLRCATPTAAAEFLIHESTQYPRQTLELIHRLGRAVNWRLDRAQSRVTEPEVLKAELELLFERKAMQLDSITSKLTRGMLSHLEINESKAKQLVIRFSAMSPLQRLNLLDVKFTGLKKRLSHAILSRLEARGAAFGKLTALLDSLSPLSVLSRGYAIVSKSDAEGRENVITDSSQVEISDRVKVRLKEGNIDCKVLERH